MKVGLFLHRYFPFGGQQRDFLGVAQALLSCGHVPEIFVMDRTDPIPLPEHVPVHFIHCDAKTNAGRAEQFSRLAGRLADQLNVDVRLGFVKMEGLSFYFCADPCLKQKTPFWKALFPRYRKYLRLEAATFGPLSRSRFFALSDEQVDSYVKAYGCDRSRFEVLLPNLHESLQHGRPVRSDGLRLLFVGSDFHRKGLDRLLRACATIKVQERIPTPEIIVVGKGEIPASLRQTCEQAGWMIREEGPQKEIRSFYQKASVLVHPARSEPGGLVLLEAMSQGLPVIATEVCGYARFVKTADAGWILSENQAESELKQRIEDILVHQDSLTERSERALSYMSAHDFFSSHSYIAKTLLKGS